MQVFARQAEQGQLAVELQRIAQMHPVLLDVPRLRIGELEAPGQPQTGAAFAQRDDGGQVRLHEKPLVPPTGATIQPVQVNLAFIQQQPWSQQRAEQGAELTEALQRLLEIAGIGQRQADFAVMAGQQALAEEETAVRCAEQAFRVADQGQQLRRADPRPATGDVFVEQPAAAQQRVAVDAARQRQVQQDRRLVMRGDEAAIPLVPA